MLPWRVQYNFELLVFSANMNRSSSDSLSGTVLWLWREQTDGDDVIESEVVGGSFNRAAESESFWGEHNETLA